MGEEYIVLKYIGNMCVELLNYYGIKRM